MTQNAELFTSEQIERIHETSLEILENVGLLVHSGENRTLNAVEETGPGGMFMEKLHTIIRMRTTAPLPEITNRVPRNQWESKGAPDSQTQALQRVREIQRGANPSIFSLDVDARIRAEFEGLVAGDTIVKRTTTNLL